MKKSEFIAATKGQYNKVIQFAGYNISITGWKGMGWELVTDTDFKVTCERSYEPIAAFRTREDLWNFIKSTPALV